MQYCGNISSTKSKRNSVKNNAMNSFYLSAQYVKKKKNTCYWLRPASTVMGQKGGLHPSQVTSLLLG